MYSNSVSSDSTVLWPSLDSSDEEYTPPKRKQKENLIVGQSYQTRSQAAGQSPSSVPNNDQHTSSPSVLKKTTNIQSKQDRNEHAKNRTILPRPDGNAQKGELNKQLQGTMWNRVKSPTQRAHVHKSTAEDTPEKQASQVLNSIENPTSSDVVLEKVVDKALISQKDSDTQPEVSKRPTSSGTLPVAPTTDVHCESPKTLPRDSAAPSLEIEPSFSLETSSLSDPNFSMFPQSDLRAGHPLVSSSATQSKKRSLTPDLDGPTKRIKTPIQNGASEHSLPMHTPQQHSLQLSSTESISEAQIKPTNRESVTRDATHRSDAPGGDSLTNNFLGRQDAEDPPENVSWQTCSDVVKQPLHIPVMASNTDFQMGGERPHQQLPPSHLQHATVRSNSVGTTSTIFGSDDRRQTLHSDVDFADFIHRESSLVSSSDNTKISDQGTTLRNEAPKSFQGPKIVYYIIRARKPKLNTRRWHTTGLSDKSAEMVFQEIGDILSRARLQQMSFRLSTTEEDFETVQKREDEPGFVEMCADIKRRIKAAYRKNKNQEFVIEIEPEPVEGGSTGDSHEQDDCEEDFNV